MKTQVGEIYMNEVINQKLNKPNKTKKYLLPCLQAYGKEFESMINSVFKVGIGVGDIVIQNRGIRHEKHLFVLIDSTIAKKFFIDFLYWIREQPMYEDDYTYGSLLDAKYHMVIIKLPIQYYDTFETFKLGKYSEMYTKKELDSFFKKDSIYRKVINKDSDYKIKFVGELNELFNSTVSPEEYDGELDLPPDKDEIFNNHIKKRSHESE